MTQEKSTLKSVDNKSILGKGKHGQARNKSKRNGKEVSGNSTIMSSVENSKSPKNVKYSQNNSSRKNGSILKEKKARNLQKSISEAMIKSSVPVSTTRVS